MNRNDLSVVQDRIHKDYIKFSWVLNGLGDVAKLPASIILENNAGCWNGSFQLIHNK